MWSFPFLPTLAPETKEALFRAFKSALWLSLVLYSGGAAAAATTTTTIWGGSATLPDIQTMLINFSTAVPNLMRLVTASSYVVGLLLVGSAVMRMKHYGEMRTQMSQEHSIWGPVIEFLIAIALLYLPSSVATMTSTFWTTPLTYVPPTGPNALFISAAYQVVGLIGAIAFIRGLLILKQAGSERGGQQHVIGKGFAHLVGGTLCINMQATLHMFAATVGMTIT